MRRPSGCCSRSRLSSRSSTSSSSAPSRRSDRDRLEALIGEYGPEAFRSRIDRLDDALALLSDPDEDRAGIDEFSRCAIEKPEDIAEIFAERFSFGCEADDPMNALAFARHLSPMGVRLRAIFSSDIGHWDVPDMEEVLPEAYELVEKGLLDENDFRDFVFAFPAGLWQGTNPDFFEGTAVEDATAAL